MDIFKWADDMNWLADYYDHHTGYVYHIQHASSRDEIFVTDIDNRLIGKVTRNKDEA